MRTYTRSKIEKAKAKRRAFHASRQKRLQAAWGPDSINTKAVFLQMLEHNDVPAAEAYHEQLLQYGNAEPWMRVALAQRAA